MPTMNLSPAAGLRLTGGLSLAIALAACTGAPPPADTGAGGTAPPADDGPRDMLVVAAGSDINTMIPIVSTSVGDSQVFSHLYMQGMESEFECQLNYVPQLYQSWEWSEDSLELTLKMRSDIKWEDGTPVTAADTVYAYEMIEKPCTASPRKSYTDGFDGPPVAVDEQTVKFKWLTPGDRITRLAQASAYSIPKHALEDHECGTLTKHALASDALETGPFKLGKRAAGSYFTLVPNDKFTGPEEMKPRLKMVRFEIVPEYQTRLLKLKKGEVDLMEGIKVKDADELRKTNPDLKLVRRGYRFMDYIAWNLNDDRFKDKQVRRAMAHAVDIDGMIDRLLKDANGEVYGKQAVGTITPEICSVRTDFDPIKQDVEKAKSMLAEAGWKDTNGDGVIDKDGVEMSFTLLTNRENERRRQAAQLVQRQLKEVGIDMKLDLIEFNAMTKRLKDREFEAVLGGWSAGLFIDPSAFWHSGPEYRFNYTSFANERVDALIDQGLATPDPAEAAPLWKEMQEIVYDEQPYMFLWWRDEIVGVDSRFENTSIDILSLTHKLNEWEVPADKVKYDL